MYFLVGLVIDDINRCPDLFDAWEQAGVGGMTILDSTGLGRMRRGEGLRDDVPLMPSIRDLLSGREEHHRTVFSLVEGEEMVDRLVDVTEQVLGPLGNPHTGVLFAVPLARVAGLQGKRT
jgi:nitrogen regulatory protein PII